MLCRTAHSIFPKSMSEKACKNTHTLTSHFEGISNGLLLRFTKNHALIFVCACALVCNLYLGLTFFVFTVRDGLARMAHLSMRRIQAHTHALRTHTAHSLSSLKHYNGTPAAVVYGPPAHSSAEVVGSVCAFNLLNPQGKFVEYSQVRCCRTRCWSASRSLLWILQMVAVIRQCSI